MVPSFNILLIRFRPFWLFLGHVQKPTVTYLFVFVYYFHGYDKGIMIGVLQKSRYIFKDDRIIQGRANCRDGPFK